MRPVVRPLVLEHPGQLRRAQRLAPGAVVAHDGHQGLVQVARRGRDLPFLLAGRIEVLDHEAVFARRHRQVAVVTRLVQAHRGAQQAAGVFQRADQRRQHGAGPAALIGAPAVIHRLAQRHRHRPQRQGLAVDDDGLADAGGFEVFVGDAADGRGLDVADRLGPFRAVLLDVPRQHLVGGRTLDVAVLATLLVGIDHHGMRHAVAACHGGLGAGRVMRHGAGGVLVPDQRLAALRIAQVEAVGRHR
jgi:hypothetical protein